MNLMFDEQLEGLITRALEHARMAREDRVRRQAQNRAAHHAHHAQRKQAVPVGPTPRCGARRKRDGLPCQARALPRGRCKHHGGMSTGPRTETGKARALANLCRGRSTT